MPKLCASRELISTAAPFSLADLTVTDWILPIEVEPPGPILTTRRKRCSPFASKATKAAERIIVATKSFIILLHTLLVCLLILFFDVLFLGVKGSEFEVFR